MDARGSIGSSPVKRPAQKFLISTIRMGGLGGVLSMLLATAVFPQAIPYARAFPKPSEEVEGALKNLQAYSGQKLPIVDGFVAAGDQPLHQYERAFYQFSIDLLPGTAGRANGRAPPQHTGVLWRKRPS